MNQSQNPEMDETAMSKWKSFKKFIKSKNLRLNYFVLAFAEGKYFFLYEVGSKISDNTPPVVAKIELSEDFSDNTPFEKVPSIFAIWLDAILSIPYPNLVGVSEG
jgi:hypothetical protein